MAKPLGRRRKAGIESAFRRLPKGFAIDIYETDESAKQLTAAYQGMLSRGTSLVIGPLTRNGTAALASFGEVPITTLALNQFEGDGSVPWNVLVFSIGVEQEAVQVADMAFQAMRRKASNPKAPRAIIITAANQVGRRAASVFHGQWQALGGEADLPIELEESALYKFREVAKKEQGDLYFLSMATVPMAAPVTASPKQPLSPRVAASTADDTIRRAKALGWLIRNLLIALVRL